MFSDNVFFDMHIDDYNVTNDATYGNAYRTRPGRATTTHSCNSIRAVPSELTFITRYNNKFDTTLLSR